MPMMMSQAELARIQRWTLADREDPEVVKKRELIRYMDETSKEMTKSWPNSLENVNKRNEELRKARIAVAEQANERFYKKYVKRRREDQERLMHSARDTVFKNKDAPKLLLSAVIETCVQKERIEQIKFLEERRREAAEKKRQEDDEILSKAKGWHELMAEKRKLRFEVDKKHQREILEQAHEVAERNRAEHEAEVNMQKIDNVKAMQQMDALQEFEENFKKAEKARIFADMEQARREAVARREEQAARDKMDDRLLEVLIKSKNRIEKRRINTEKSVKEEKRRILEAISARLESGEATRAARDQEIMEKAHREMEAIAESRRVAAAQKKAESTAERKLQRELWLQREAKRMHDLDEQLQWDCMNRFKNLELYGEFQDQLRAEKARKVAEYREDMLRLWRERAEREARERAETRYFYGALAEQKMRHADRKLLAHAQALVREARAHERPDHALHKAIDRYCSMYRLYPMPDLPASMKEHFPQYAPHDASEPGPSPAQTTPASPRAGPAPASSRYGLQPHPEKDTPAAATKVEKEENVADYKRASKANGLQRKAAENDATLPPITVVPCKNETCCCPLRK